MKLLKKTNRTYLFFSAILLLIAGCLLYAMMTTIIDDEITEKLFVNKERIVRQMEKGERVIQLPPVIEVEELLTPQEEQIIVKDTSLLDPVEDETELFREVTSIENINSKTYRITLRQVILEPHDYYNSIGLALAIVFALLLTGILLINWCVSKKLWSPFYQTLEKLKQFSLQDDKPVPLDDAGITEFKEMNHAIEHLTSKVRSDYHALKEFTENASHEIQTPLAVILAKLQELLQSAALSAEQAGQIQTAYASAQRLSKLNQTLLLLAKIENKQFPATEKISLTSAIQRQLELFADFIAAKHLNVKKKFHSETSLSANALLLDVLLSNLIGNAIRHNIMNGNITIELSANTLSISNTGKPLIIPPEKLFERFAKADPASESLGLGLAIVKKLCDSYGWKIRYTVSDGCHVIEIVF